MTAPLAERIAKLKKRRESLTAELNTLAAKAKKEARRNETRRKIVVGAAVLAAMERDPGLAPQLGRLLRRFVTRDHDKAVVADLMGAFPDEVNGRGVG